MPNGNSRVVALLEELADLLEVSADDSMRARALRTAARVVAHQPPDYAERIARGESLPRLPGVGAEVDAQVQQLAREGRCDLLDALRRTVAPGTAALLKVPGLGPHRVRVLVQTLGINTPEELRAAARAGQIREVVGFGPRTEQRVLEALEGDGPAPPKIVRARAQMQADDLLDWMRGAPWVERIEVAGALRRGCALIDEIALIAVGPYGAPIGERFVRYPLARRIAFRGPRRAAIQLDSGIEAELRIAHATSFGAALMHLTGPREFVAALRRLAQARGLRLSEHGVYDGLRRLPCESEEAVFAALGLALIAPEQRDDLNRLPAAAQATAGSGA